jgi:hypothetical protein
MPAAIWFRIFYLSLCCLIYKTIIVSVVLCGCESCSLTLREESMLRVLLYLFNKQTNAQQ